MRDAEMVKSKLFANDESNGLFPFGIGRERLALGLLAGAGQRCVELGLGSCFLSLKIPIVGIELECCLGIIPRFSLVSCGHVCFRFYSKGLALSREPPPRQKVSEELWGQAPP